MHCRLCRLRKADSKEHVFPSAIGGRWAVAGVLCRSCNSACGRGIDAYVARGFHDLRVILGVKGDRGQAPTMEKVDEHGRRLIFRPGMALRAADGPPEVFEHDGQHRVVGIMSTRAARAYIRAQERKWRSVTVTSGRIYWRYAGSVSIRVEFQGDQGGFRSCVKTVLTLIAAAGHEGQPDVLRSAWRYVSGDSPEACGVSIGFSAAPAPVDGDSAGLGAVSHRVVVRSNADRGQVEADLRLFGDLGVCVRLAAPGVDAFCIGYGVDPLTGTSRRLDDWSGAVGIPGVADRDEVLKAFAAATVASVLVAEERIADHSRHELISDAMTEAGVPCRGPIPAAAWARLERILPDRVMEYILRLDSCRDAPELVAQLVAKRVHDGRGLASPATRPLLAT